MGFDKLLMSVFNHREEAKKVREAATRQFIEVFSGQELNTRLTSSIDLVTKFMSNL